MSNNISLIETLRDEKSIDLTAKIGNCSVERGSRPGSKEIDESWDRLRSPLVQRA